MNADRTFSAGRPLGRVVSVHALGWLVACNLVGVWLATILLWPSLGDRIAPLSYGRWMPVHLDGQLYGWCALPLVGALLAWCLDPVDPRGIVPARLVLAAWSTALTLGVVSWLSGLSSGKLFLDWAGWTRPLLPLAMVMLWAVLAWQVVARWRRGQRMGVQAAALVLLAAVPPVLWWSMGPATYPAINPDSGGATGASLLGSTLGIIAIFGAVPRMIGLDRRPGAGGSRVFWSCFAVSAVVYAVIGHGDESHHAAAQILGLGVLLAWIPLLVVEWRASAWPWSARRWLRAAEVWWAGLVISGWVSFLPGVSERWKFSNALVGHAHLAMAGFVTSANGALLAALGGRGCPGWAFWTWQLGCGAMVVLLIGLGSIEAGRIGDLFLSAPWVQVIYAGRLAAGAAMTVASLAWWREASRP